MRYVGIRSAQSVVICVKGYIFVLREKEIDTRGQQQKKYEILHTTTNDEVMLLCSPNFSLANPLRTTWRKQVGIAKSTGRFELK